MEMEIEMEIEMVEFLPLNMWNICANIDLIIDSVQSWFLVGLTDVLFCLYIW